MFDFLNVLGALGVLITFLMNIKSDKKGRKFSKEASSIYYCLKISNNT
jgi:hypothetical protein